MPGQVRANSPELRTAMPDSNAAAESGQGTAMQHFIWVAFLGLLYIAISSCLIAYNKYLMTEDRFPYAICLVLLHATFCSSACAILYLVKPSLFPSLTDPAKMVKVDSDLMLKGALPIAVFFSAQLVLSNTAYLHSSVAFLQMMKEANLVLVYTFSLIACLEKFSWRSCGILAFIIFATTLTIHGEVNFSMTGFMIQGCGQIFECCKIVLQAMLLSSAGRKLDALTYVMLVMPLCAALLAGGIFVLNFFPLEHFLIPAWQNVVNWWPHLAANCCVAFALNVCIALFIKHASAVAFILAGIVKDAMIVATSVIVLREVISSIQVFGFGLQLSAIFLWSTIKTFPDRFEDSILGGLLSFVTTQQPIAGKAEKGYGSTEEGSKC